jgi:hypothetical protein
LLLIGVAIAKNSYLRNYFHFYISFIMRFLSALKLTCLSLLFLCFGAFSATAQKKGGAKPSAKLVKIVKAATGIYDSQNSFSAKVDTIANPQMRRQMILCYPIWESTSGKDRWMYFGWFSPNDNTNALEEVFLRLYEQDDKVLADWYEIPQKHKETFSQEWLKAKPFETLMPEDIANEDGYVFATCDVNADNSGYLMKAREKGEFRAATPAAYKYMLIDMGFYPDHYSSGSRFYAADGKTVIIAHEHTFGMEKVNKKYKKF